MENAIAILLAVALAVAADTPASSHADEEPFAVAVFGLELRVPDVDAAVGAWRSAYGFETLEWHGESAAVLANGALRLVLVEGEAPPPPGDAAGASLNLRVGDLDAAAAAVEAVGGAADAVLPFPLGVFCPTRDPVGHPVDLVTLEDADGDPERPEVFNLGLNVEAYEEAETFLGALGLRVASRSYLPQALPFEPAGAAALVVHADAPAPHTGRADRVVLLAVERLEPALEVLASRGLVQPSAVVRKGPVGRTAELSGPSGIPFRLVERSPQRETFERFRRMAGTWEGESTMGWRNEVVIEVIARGTVVAQRSNFEAHPGETMMTFFHMDEERLLLTHYCVAGNQPRLEATRFSEDGGEVVFTWLDGTGLASRDEGHMDEVVYTFDGPDACASTWSWYEAGSQRPMESVRNRRVVDPTGGR